MADQSATGAPQNVLGTEGNPIHVVSRKEDDPIISRPAPTFGWAGVMSGIEGFDKEEIQGYKEDMDALLVFIGLFSAVLAGFVAMSYSSLGANPADLMVFVMMGMSIQAASYTIQGGFINSTTPAPTSLPHFEPTDNAIVVNTLWTASLIVSLATASGAILVKQWLRGYTASTTSFAMYKMRIRFFRRRALEDWHVLDIASALPLLLQISLAFFFIGLYYFTADIHPSVKNTTLPLVSAWAFFFIAATILPIFSARCPYKTPALSSLTTLARNGLRPVLRPALRLLWKKMLRTLVVISANERSADRRKWSHILSNILVTIRIWLFTALFRLLQLRTGAAQRLRAIREHLDEHSGFIGAISAMVHVRAIAALASMDDEVYPPDEVTAMKTNTQDHTILHNADRLHGNDEVTDIAISRAVIENKVKWKDAIAFTQGLIRNRLSSDPFVGMPEFIDLRDLAPRALAAVHNVLNYVDSVQVQEPDKSFPLLNPNEDAISDIGPARWAIFLRLSVSLLQPPTKLPRWLESCHQHDSRRLAKICSPSESAPALRSLLTLICRRLERPDFDLSTSVSRLQVFLGVYFDELHVPDSFGAEQPKPWSDVLNAESLGPTIAWLTLRLKSDVRSRETAWGDAVELIVKLMAISEHTGDFGEIPPVAVKSSEILGKFWISCFSYRLHASQFLVPQGSLDADGLTNIKTAIAALASDPPPQIDGRKALSLCDDLCFSLYNDHRDGRASNLVPAWRGVFDALTQLVQHTQVEDSDAAMRLVNWCFSRIEGFDGINNSDDDAEYAAWLATFKSEDSPVPDEFILELLRINSNPHYPLNEEESYLRLWRVRRLNELSNNAQSQPKGTAIPYTPGTTLPTSDVDGDNQGNTPQSSASAADGGNIQTDPTALPPVNSHLSYSPSETSLEAQHAETDALIGHPPNDSTPEPVPTDSSDALSYVNIHDLRYPPAGDQAAPTDSSDALSYVDVNETPCDPPTAVQGSEEAGSFEITPAESNHDEEMTPHFEGVPTAVEPIMNDEAESAAATAIPVEDATDPRQTEAVQDHAPNSDHDRRPSTPAPSATLDSTSVLPTEIDEESHLAQDVRSEDRGVQPASSSSPSDIVSLDHPLGTDLTTTPVNPESEPHEDPPHTPSSAGEDERQSAVPENISPSRTEADAAVPLDTRGTSDSENMVGVSTTTSVAGTSEGI